MAVLASCGNDGTKSGPGQTDSSGGSGKKITSSHFIYNFPDTVLGAMISDTLMKLSFIQKTNIYIDSLTGHRQGISFMPDTVDNTISVMAGYNGPERFETYYHFTIDPKTFDIKILDEMNGEFVSIDEYLKNHRD